MSRFMRFATCNKVVKVARFTVFEKCSKVPERGFLECNAFEFVLHLRSMI
jgi:hypothetical protein